MGRGSGSKGRKGGKVWEAPGGKAELPLENLDLTAKRYEWLVTIPGLGALLDNPADEPVMQALTNCMLAAYTTGGIAFWAYWQSSSGAEPWLGVEMSQWVHIFGVLHLVNMYVVWLQRFVLSLHYASHRRLFKRTWWGNILNPWFASYIVCAPFGVPPGSYELHHIAMHHVENNVPPEDLTATMTLQRDSPWSVFGIWLDYPVRTPMHLISYGMRTGRTAQALRMGIIFPLYFVTGLYLAFFGGKSGLAISMYLFFVPFFITSVALMFGNFSQHIFVNPDDIEVNTYNLINTHENQLTFNDGYHQVHHDVSTLHWSEMPSYFMDNLDEFAARDVFVFNNLGFVDVGIYVFSGRLRELAKHYVHYGQTKVPRTEDEIVAEFKRRLAPIPLPEKK